VTQRVDLVIDALRGQRVPIDLPLSYRVPVETTRDELGISPTVDCSDPIVAKAVALLGAARRADPPVHLAVFGGTAHRLACPSSNAVDLGLRHELHDLDIAVLQKEGRSFRRFLANVAVTEGSGLTFFETPGDGIFNSTSDGRRLRWHMVVGQMGPEVVLGTLDIIADDFEFCHRMAVREDILTAPSHGWTLTPTHLLIAKGQFIQRIPREDGSLVPDRVLESFGKHEVVIGPEAKDVQDLLALVHDHPVDDSPSGISPTELTRLLVADWGLWKTLGLNLAMVARSPILASLSPRMRARIGEQIEKLRAVVDPLTPKRRLGFLGGPWWQEVDATAFTDTTVPTSGPS
jgi:hypothetical protein